MESRQPSQRLETQWPSDLDRRCRRDYRLDLTYKGEGKLVWRIETDEGVTLQNQQNSSPIYHSHPFGLLTFKTTGRHTIAVSLIDGPADKASLQAIRLSPVE
jgi:alpha-L-fucosidase